MSAARAATRLRQWLALALVAVLGLACERSDDSSVVIATDSTISSAPKEAPAEPTPAQTAPNGPLAAFGIPDGKSVAATIKITPVWLINGTSMHLTVRASGGAGEVELGAVASGDSVMVRLETWADTVVIEAIAGANAVGTVAVPMNAATQRVAFPR